MFGSCSSDCLDPERQNIYAYYRKELVWGTEFYHKVSDFLFQLYAYRQLKIESNLPKIEQKEVTVPNCGCVLFVKKCVIL